VEAYAYKVENMSDTPQNDDAIENVDVIETNDSVMDSEAITPVEGESEVQQVDEVEAAKQKANDAFNKQYGEKKQLERDLAAQREENAKFQQAERDRQAAKVGTIPDMPDSFDDDFDQKMKERDEALIAQANFNTQNQNYQQQQQFQQQQEAQAKQVKVQESMASYSQKATELGIKQEELQAAGNTVAQYGLSDDLVMHILADSDGPLITKHLAANPQEGFQLAQMSPFLVGNFLDGIRTKASALKPRTSNAPNPSDNLQGKGHKPSSQHKHIGGATFS
jgi:hypothetical protein